MSRVEKRPQQWMASASQVAEEVYRKFLSEVVEECVAKDRKRIENGDQTKKKMKEGQYADPREIRLMTVSGKGGYSPDPERAKVYVRFQNVTLLDHLLSVTRGGMILYAFDQMNRNPEMDSDLLRKRLSVVGAVGFSHDLDKDLGLVRDASLEIEAVAERMERYGIERFLTGYGVELSASQMRYLVEKVESTQAHRHAPDDLPPREFEAIPLYVRLADKLDGAWLSSDPETGGFAGVIRRLEKDRSCLHSDLLTQWKPVRLFDPHHPFLLDELQRWLSVFSLRMAGVPPLIEVHQDGHLFMLLPENGYAEIVKRALNTLGNRLPFNLELDVSGPGVPSLYNAQPSHERLSLFIREEMEQKHFSNLFKVKRFLMDELTDPLDELLSPIGLQPRWSPKGTTALVSIYPSLKDIEIADFEWLYMAAHLAMLLNLKVDAKARDNIPTYQQREQKLLSILAESPPEWISRIENEASRRTITALWATALSAEDSEIIEAIWGDDEGLLKNWLEGDEEQPGFNRFIKGDNTSIQEEVFHHFNQLLLNVRVVIKDESAKGRCLFTNEPVDFKQKINQSYGLYEVNISAFSGRDNRPETLTSERSHTNVGNVSIAEHKLRAEVHKKQGGKKNGVPALISSPTTSGLFGGLAVTDDRAMGALSLYDITHLEIKKGKVIKGSEIYHGRFRMARLERIPESLAGQINILRMMITACRRMGRPIHIFRGLPTLQRAFFFFDAMSRALADLLGGNALCLEQLPDALARLDTAQQIIEENGLGHDVLKLYAGRQTRFGAICFSYCHLSDQKGPQSLIRKLYGEFLTYMEESKAMSEQDGALVRFGEAAAGIQKYPGRSTSDELLVFKLSLDAVNEAQRRGQVDEKSLIYAVAGILETNLVRRGKAAGKKWRGKKTLLEGCMDVAQLFINDIWKGVMKEKNPSQKSRQVLSSIYRMAFIKAHRGQSNLKTDDEDQTNEGAN